MRTAIFALLPFVLIASGSAFAWNEYTYSSEAMQSSSGVHVPEHATRKSLHDAEDAEELRGQKSERREERAHRTKMRQHSARIAEQTEEWNDSSNFSKKIDNVGSVINVGSGALDLFSRLAQ